MNPEDLKKHLDRLIRITDDIGDFLIKVNNSSAEHASTAQSLYKRYADWQNLYYWQLWTGEVWKDKNEESCVND